MATEANSVVVIQDASKELNVRVFHWVLSGLSLKPEDTVTLVAILHRVYTPMGYSSRVDDSTMVGANQRVIEEQLARKKGNYQHNEELAKIAKLYDSHKVTFKIQLFTGSSLREVALKEARNLKATWVILDRQMKKDEELFLQNLSCGISRLMRNNRIVWLREPIDLPVVIHCNSYDESLPENQYEDLLSIEVYPKRPIKVDEQNQQHCRPTEEEGFLTLTSNININEETCQTSPHHLSMDEKDINSNQKIGKMEEDKQSQNQEQIQCILHKDEKHKTRVINNDQEISNQLDQDDEEWGLRHPSKRKNVIGQTEDDLLNQNEAQNQNISRGVILDGQQEKSTLKNSMCFICSICKTRRSDIEWQKEFTYEELQTATDGFSLKNCLSEFGYLSTFKGLVEGEVKIVVKQHEITKCHEREKMKEEVQKILNARHKNVVMLLGSSIKEHFLLTVYEYACNGSLDNYLSKESRRPLIWRERAKVAIGLARGLKYLHDNNIVHGNIKPSNILLTHDFKPMLGDFGFGKKLEYCYKFKNKGNPEYIAPEYQEKGKLSNKTDVYSFGVVILELITGRRAADKISGEKNLVGWAKPLLGGKKDAELIDSKIRNSYEEDQLSWLVQVTAQCLKKNPKERLSMNMVVSALQGIEDMTEDLTIATSRTRIVPDMNESQVKVVSTLQGIEDSKQFYMTDHFTPALSNSRFVPDITGSQGPKEANHPIQEEEQLERSSISEETRLILKVKNNHFYMTDQKDSNSLNQIEEHTQNSSQGKERSLGKMEFNDHIMDQTKVDQLSELEEEINNTLFGKVIPTQKISINHITCQIGIDKLSKDQEHERSYAEMMIGLRPAAPVTVSGLIDQTKSDQIIKPQLNSSLHEKLLDGHHGKIILENSKSSACSICKHKRPNIASPKNFTYDEILEATEGFQVNNSLSESEDGPTFKGLLDSKVNIVVKKFQTMRTQEEKAFKSEIRLLTNAIHKHVVMLLGLCTDKSQLMIVYEKVCNGSLDQCLTRGSLQSLTWKQRTKVAIGIARGLKYLHGNNIIHGNIKPSNILLTHDFEPLIGDFGFGMKFSNDKSVRNSGYTAPEYIDSGKLSNKTDVFSFGVVLLELITGRRATDKLSGGKTLVGWARPLLGGKKYPQLVDPKISNSYEEEQLLWLVQVTEQCLRKNPKDRFSMNMVISALQSIADSNEGCAMEDSSQEISCLPHDELHDDPAMASSQEHERLHNNNHVIGQMKAYLVSREQELIDRNPYEEEERSLRLASKTNHIMESKAHKLRQNGKHIQSSPHEEMSSVTVISNMIDQMKPGQQIPQKQYNKGTFQEDLQRVDKEQMVRKDQKQMQGSFEEDLQKGDGGKIILENSKSSICSICKSSRPSNEWQENFPYEQLHNATEGFSIKYSLSEDEYGPAFIGQMDNKMKIVVKKYRLTNSQEEKVFMSQVQLLANSRHENVIMLLGSCKRESKLLVVYEYACNGSLDQYLSRTSCRLLTWRERMKIAIGVSRGLKYLHENNIIHGRIKPSNILLNHEFKPLLGDFQFGKERGEVKNSCQYKSMQKYRYTEYQESGKPSTKADVYSLGVVLLELITGCMITENLSGQKCLIEWARPLLGGRKYLQLLDPRINNSYDEEELVLLVQVIEKCLKKKPKERFTMNMVVSALPSVVNSNDIYATEDSSSENSYANRGVSELTSLTHTSSDRASSTNEVTGPKVEEEPLEEEDLGTEYSKENEDNITCSGNNSETEISQDNEESYTCQESGTGTQEKESPGTNVCQNWEGHLSYGGARDYYHEGTREYTVREELFSLCHSI